MQSCAVFSPYGWSIIFPLLDSIAYIEFKSEAEAEKMLEETQGTDVQGRSIMVDFVGDKSQKGGKVSGNNS